MSTFITCQNLRILSQEKQIVYTKNNLEMQNMHSRIVQVKESIRERYGLKMKRHSFQVKKGKHGDNKQACPDMTKEKTYFLLSETLVVAQSDIQ